MYSSLVPACLSFRPTYNKIIGIMKMISIDGPNSQPPLRSHRETYVVYKHTTKL